METKGTIKKSIDMNRSHYTCRTTDEYLTCLTSERAESRTNAILKMLSFAPQSSIRCLRSIEVKGAPVHLTSTLNDYTRC